MTPHPSHRLGGREQDPQATTEVPAFQWNIADSFECVADAVPNQVAIACGERRLTYASVDERATRLAHHLDSHGVRRGDRVAVDLHDSPEHLESLLAIWKLRAVAINVNWRYTAAELTYLLDDAGAAAAVVHSSLAAPLLQAARDLPDFRALVNVDDGAGPVSGATDYAIAVASASGNARNARRKLLPRSADDLYILYTGGTTGLPKGVMWRHEDVLFAGMLGPDARKLDHPGELAERARGEGNRLLPACPLMHGTGQWSALSTLLSGGTVVLPDRRGLDPRGLWDLIARERVEVLVVVGDAVTRPMVHALEASLAALPQLRRLRFVLSTGAALAPATKKTLGELLPETVIVDAWGSSETGPQARRISDGRSSAVESYTVDGDTTVLGPDLVPLSPGSQTTGRLARRGHIALGYWNDPERTAATFPTVNGVRWCVNGDHARIEADGSIVVLGRGAACINTGGEKVYPEEVEAVLKGHPDVLDAIVVGVPDERWGERVVALVQARAGTTVDASALEAHARRFLAAYKAPRSILVVEAVRRSATGKPDYTWAREMAVGRLAV